MSTELAPEPVNLDPKSELAEAHKECVQNGGVVSPRLAAAVNALTTSIPPAPNEPVADTAHVETSDSLKGEKHEAHTAHKKGH